MSTIRPAIQLADLASRKTVSKQDAKRLLGVSDSEFERLWALRMVTSLNRIKADEILAVVRRMRSGWSIPLRVVKDMPAHLYVLELVDCCVKVGISKQPTERLRQHADLAGLLGRSAGRVWVSIPHKEARANEVALQGDSKREYLRRGFEDVVSQAIGLPMTRVETGGNEDG